jgi:transketolase
VINTKTKTVDLKKLSSNLRRDILMMITNVNSGHAGGSLSELEILITLYQSILNIDPLNPDKKDRDRFILSKGHASPGLYAVLSNKGFFPRSDLGGFRKLGSHLQGHTHIGTPGVEMSGGSLGQGLSFGVGIALAENIDKHLFY